MKKPSVLKVTIAFVLLMSITTATHADRYGMYDEPESYSVPGWFYIYFIAATYAMCVPLKHWAERNVVLAWTLVLIVGPLLLRLLLGG
ncbi:MAG: hypothetical protein AB8B63_06475 [Granulosicoccus sp.]